MRIIKSSQITEVVKELCIKANIYLGEDVKQSIKEYETKENSELGKNILNILMKNYEIAEQKQMPMCQDTGMAVFFVQIGQEVQIQGQNINDAINEGVRQGYEDGY